MEYYYENQKNKNLTFWDDHLDKKYGEIRTQTREKYEQEFESFKLGIPIQEARKKRHLTQEELALKVGTTKNTQNTSIFIYIRTAFSITIYLQYLLAM